MNFMIRSNRMLFPERNSKINAIDNKTTRPIILNGILWDMERCNLFFSMAAFVSLKYKNNQTTHAHVFYRWFMIYHPVYSFHLFKYFMLQIFRKLSRRYTLHESEKCVIFLLYTIYYLSIFHSLAVQFSFGMLWTEIFVCASKTP